MERIHRNETVLFITSCFPPYVGASERRNSHFVYALRRFTKNIHVLSYHISPSKIKMPYFQEEMVKHIRTVRFTIKAKWIGKLLLFKKFINPLYIWLCFLSSLIFMLIRKVKYVFVTVPSFPLGFSVALACKILRKRLILDLHDIPGSIRLDWHKLFNGSLIVPLSISGSKLIVSVNNPIKKEASFFKSPSSIRVIPNGIDSEIIRNMTKNSRLQTAVFVGGASLDWYYEPEFLIKTVSFLKEINSDINLKIVGASNSLQITLSKLIKKYNLTDYVTICSPKPLEELYDMLLRSSVGIIQFSKKSMTFYDYAASLLALPAKVVEYLACGLSVAYRGPNGPLVRFITRNSVGAIVDTESPKVFASCINDAFQLRQENPSHFDDFSKKVLHRYDQITLFNRFLQKIFY